MEPARVMFTYWGRRGALPQFTLEVGRAALDCSSVDATISVSRQNQAFDSFHEMGGALFPVDTFRADLGALIHMWRIPLLRRRLYNRLRHDRTQVVVELMPHVWSWLIASVVKRAGARYVTIIHDANSHKGDSTKWVKLLIDRALPKADLVLTLSEAVKGQLIATGKVPKSKLFTLFHPDLGYSPATRHNPPLSGEPLKLLFLGRIMPYKGLPLFLDMVDLLIGDGIDVQVGVFGEGPLGGSAKRLQAIGAEVVNRWLSAGEIANILNRHHAVVLSHIAASQSGVAAAAIGSGLPVVSTPVGGLVEQVVDGVTGTLAARADAEALADAVKRLLLDADFYRAVCDNIAKTRAQRSMACFMEDCVAHGLFAGLPTGGQVWSAPPICTAIGGDVSQS